MARAPDPVIDAAEALPGAAGFGVYLHIPYCRTLCPYCDFVKERRHGPVPDVFVDAICQEIAAYEGPRRADSVFFGGGTPSLLRPESLERILGALDRTFALTAAEITLEANPDDVTPELARAWKALGVNRVSLGVQSFDEDTLRYLGRRHDAAAARRACGVIAETFETWNLDLIFGAPPIERWQATLDTAAGLAPPHIAAYGLSYEAGTPFARRKSEAVDEDVALALYQMAETAFDAYVHYEISNFARPGHESRHNLIYWRNGGYAGFGTGAYSFIGNLRARNPENTAAYLAAPGVKSEAIQLSGHEIRMETLIQHFRLAEGLPRADYRARFGADPETDFGPALSALQARGLLTSDARGIRPTREGFYLNNEIGMALVG